MTADQFPPHQHDIAAQTAPCNLASAALLVTEGGRYLMQLRDDKAGIWYPGQWGLFGGAVNPGETPEDALVRELWEELELRVRRFRFFTRMVFHIGDPPNRVHSRLVYEIPLVESEISKLVLHEGSDMGLFEAQRILCGIRAVPYDQFAVSLHASRGHIADMEASGAERHA